MIMVLLGVMLGANVFADDVNLDVIDKKLDKVIGNQDKIYERVANEPLKGKHYGVELNIFRIIALQKDWLTFSGGFSLFDTNNKTEIAFPVFVSSTIPYDDFRFSYASIDVHYRQFLGGTLNGFYISGFSRGTYLKGRLGSEWEWFSDEKTENEYGSEMKIGVGVGIGYRVFSKTGYYWGVGLIVGRYLVGENDKFTGDILDEDSEFILDMELLKFGYAF